MQTVKINDIDIRAYGIEVMKIKGAFDMPARFGTYEMDWQDIDGIDAFTEQSDLYYKQRKLSLDCIMEAETINDLQFNMGIFREIVYKEFTLETPYSNHNCIMTEGARVKFISSKYDPDVKISFTLIFNELSYAFGTTLEPDENITNDVFWIDNIDLSRFGIVVEESEGFFDFTKMKSDKVTRYMRESDKVNKRGARDIILSCSMLAESISEFKTQMERFHALLSQPGLREFMLPLPGLEKPYNVFVPDGFRLKELIQSQNSIAGKFDLILSEVEPQPETFYLIVLLDIDGIPILTIDGKYIYVIADRNDLKNQNVYLYTIAEAQDDIFLFTKEELDPEDEDYDSESEEVYLYKISEL